MTRTIRITQCMFLAAALVGVGGLLAIGSARLSAQGATVTVHDAWVREVAANRAETAVFAIVENSGAAMRSVVGGSTDAAAKLELHEMKMSGTMMQMSPVKKIDVPAHGKTELKPGGLHIMLFGLKKAPVAGEVVNLTLTLDDGTSVTFPAQVRKPEGMK